MSKIPPTKNAPQPKAPAAVPQQFQIADMATITLWVVQINDHLRAAGTIATQLFNEIDKRQAIINSLASSPVEKPEG